MDGDVAETLEELGETFDAVVLDPPRAGCTPETIAALAGTCAGRIAYVSCDPATLARDVALFVQHGYHVEQVQPVDMFPQTYHVETVVLLQKPHQGQVG